MGARHSKRVEISSASKKGDVENGAIVGTEEKLEKIEEGETVVSSKSNANGSTTTSSTVTAEQQETTTTNTEVTAAPETSPSKELEGKSETITDVAATEKSINEEVISPSAADDSKQEVTSPASPSEATTTTTEEGASSSKKKKGTRKKWSFRTFSFSRKDKSKPVVAKEEQKQQETLAEANETVAPSETQNNEDAEKKTKEEDEKKDEQVPPPLPKSPPPTPAEEIAVVAPPTAPVTAVPAAVPEKEETLNISDGDVAVSGGGEGLAEPLLEDGELLDVLVKSPINGSEPTVDSNGTASLTNGEVKLNGTVTENGNSTSPVCELKTPVAVVENLAAKIDALKLHNIATDNAETPAQNGFADHSVNGDLNGSDVNGGSECQLPSDSVVSVDVSADVSADN